MPGPLSSVPQSRSPLPALCRWCSALRPPAPSARCCRPARRSSSGVSDTGDPADFGHFTNALHKHPALIESFRTWGTDFPDSIERWQTARARPMIHITTADNSDGHELITPRAIAARRRRRLPDPPQQALLGRRRCAPTCGRWASPTAASTSTPPTTAPATSRDAAHSPRRYKRAFRRIYVIVHGGGKRGADRRAASREAGLPPLTERRRRPAEGAGRGDLEPAARRLADRPPEPAANTSTPARAGSTGSGTDFYSDNQDWKALDRPLPPLLRQALRDHRVGRRQRRRPDLRQQAASPGSTRHRALPRCSSTTRTSARPAPTGSRTTRPASRARNAPLRALPAFAPVPPRRRRRRL